MARNDITDRSHRASNDPAIAAIGLAEGGAIVYDQDNPDAWIESTEATDLEEVQ